MKPKAIIFAIDSKRKTPIETKSNQYRALANPPLGSDFGFERPS